MLTLDLTVFHRHSKEMSIREAASWTIVWASLAIGFNGLVWYLYGYDNAVLFLTGYVVEWSLSMDNVFVFAVVFNFFRVPKKYQYRVLFWGILGAVLMRLIFIAVGAELLKRVEWIMLVFGVFLLYTGFKLALLGDTEAEPHKNLLLRVAKRLFPVATRDHGDKFFVVESGRRCITPLFLVLLVVESTDVMFAVDSVPAIFGITKEPFLIFTSNIFAILGLRALYFLLAGVMDMFRYMHYGLAGVLIFVGLKMVAEFFVEHYESVRATFSDWLWDVSAGQVFSPMASLLVIVCLLAVSVVASLAAGPIPEERDEKDDDNGESEGDGLEDAP